MKNLTKNVVVAVIVAALAIVGVVTFNSKEHNSFEDFGVYDTLEGTIRVQDFDGGMIETYEGTFDIVTDNSRISFRDETGKRHYIGTTTFNVLIDEQ